MSEEIKQKKSKKSFFSRTFVKALDFIEVVGNRLPHPATIFAGLAGLVILLSVIGYFTNVSAVHPVDDSVIKSPRFTWG